MRQRVNPLMSSEIPSVPDWKEFFEESLRSRTAPFIFWRTLRPCVSRIPPEIYRRFENAYLTTVARNAGLLEELKVLLTAFRQENIRALIFKGAYLARHVYEDPGLRPMTDIDFLIARRDILRADALLVRLGYARPFGTLTLERADFNGYNNSILYHPPEHGRAFAHLHWHLLNFQSYRDGLMRSFDIARVWREACETSFEGVSSETLSPAHHLVYLCFHAFKHAFRPTLSLIDMAVFLEKNPGLNGDDVARQARELGLAPYVYHAGAVLQASGLGAAGFWGDVTAALKPEKVSIFERRFVRAALRRDKRLPMAGLGWALLGMNRSWRDRARFVTRALFPKRCDMAFIRQKDIDKVGWRDYVSRLLTGIS